VQVCARAVTVEAVAASAKLPVTAALPVDRTRECRWGVWLAANLVTRACDPPLIDFGDLLGADLAGYKTITVYSTKVMHVSTEKWERGDVPSPAGALPDPLAMLGDLR
jgi:hypothetical protein